MEQTFGTFIHCTSLVDVSPLAGWDMSKNEVVGLMFYGCTALKDASALEAWKLPAGCDSDEAFPEGCITPSWYTAASA